jgi:hypothetical protein
MSFQGSWKKLLKQWDSVYGVTYGQSTIVKWRVHYSSHLTPYNVMTYAKDTDWEKSSNIRINNWQIHLREYGVKDFL